MRLESGRHMWRRYGWMTMQPKNILLAAALGLMTALAGCATDGSADMFAYSSKRDLRDIS